MASEIQDRLFEEMVMQSPPNKTLWGLFLMHKAVLHEHYVTSGLLNVLPKDEYGTYLVLQLMAEVYANPDISEIDLTASVHQCWTEIHCERKDGRLKKPTIQEIADVVTVDSDLCDELSYEEKLEYYRYLTGDTIVIGAGVSYEHMVESFMKDFGHCTVLHDENHLTRMSNVRLDSEMGGKLGVILIQSMTLLGPYPADDDRSIGIVYNVPFDPAEVIAAFI